MPHRSRKEHLTYQTYITKVKNCEFCKLTADDPVFVSESKYFYVVRNKFPYSYWDIQPVIEHLLLIPKKHTDSLSKLPKEAAVEFVDTISKYEKNGFGVYARTPGSVQKSIAHQHTHLIKTDKNTRHTFILYSRRPYLRFIR